MEVVIEFINGTALVLIPGDSLDASNAKEFKTKINPLLEKHLQVIFDMHELNFIDSSGLGTVLSCLRSLKGNGGDLKLFGLSRQVRVIFELVRMDKIIGIYNTREEAIKAFH